MAGGCAWPVLKAGGRPPRLIRHVGPLDHMHLSMIKAILIAVLFVVVGAVAFALLAPLLFRGGDFEKIGAAAFPIILLVCGGTGFFYGLRHRKKQ